MKKIMIILLFSIAGLYARPENNEVDAKVDALLKSMTLEEKIGQMTQSDYTAIANHPEDVIQYSIGSILWGGSSEVKDVTGHGWKEVCDSLQGLSEKTRLKIPILFGIDAVHGHNNVTDAVIFPHNIGLGATRNPELLEQIGKVTAEELKGTGIQWDFAPCIAVARNIRWGRTYESYGEDPSLVSELGAAYIKGMQGDDLSRDVSALACAKHFLGDGGTVNGKDQGDTECDYQTLMAIHLPGYVAAIKAGAKSVMASYSSWNGNKMHGNKDLLTGLLKGRLHFDGFIVSDWAGIDQLPGDFKEDIQQSINAGLDMIMLPNGLGGQNNYVDFVTDLKELVQEGKVSNDRIDDAVRRILKVKYELGLFDKRYTDNDLTDKIGSLEHREVARKAVRQSFVLLKNNDNILPVSKNAKRVVVVGKYANDIGAQCGGWTISWQGDTGKTITGGTTILDGIKKAVSNGTKVVYSADGSTLGQADVIIAVVGEKPYAEMIGDRSDLNLSDDDIALVNKVKASGIPVVTLLLSGRPMILGTALDNSDAFAAIWLPGSEGEGIADVLFGDYAPTGKLSHSWPKDMQQIPINVGDKAYDPLFPYGFGLTYPVEKAMK